MKNILILFFAFSVQNILGQTENKDILKATDEALDKWAPGYNRKYGTPTISECLADSKWKNNIEGYHLYMAGEKPVCSGRRKF